MCPLDRVADANSRRLRSGPELEVLRPIVITHTIAVVTSIYVGFCAYMLALSGQLDECDRRVDQLRRVTRRQRAPFEVDTVGNGFAAAILTSMTRGDLRGAARHHLRRRRTRPPHESVRPAHAEKYATT